MVQTANIRGVDISWEFSGDGRTLVWGHGLQSNMADEDSLGLLDFDELLRANQVLRYDARGHGTSGFTTVWEEYGWDQLAQDQLALATHAGVDTYVAGGASLGAATALHAAVAAPERIQALVLVIPPTGWETRAAQTQFYTDLADLVEAKGVGPLIAGMDGVPVPDPLVGNEQWRDHRIASMRAADPVRMAGRFRGATKANLPPRDAVASITCPTLILAWTGDPGHPTTTVAELQHLMPHANAKLASTAAHMATWSHEVAAFMSSL